MTSNTVAPLIRPLFQSTHPRRVWHNVAYHLTCSDLFQSTHPRRVWPMLRINSRCFIVVSIHTPTKGVTHFFNDYFSRILGFNPHTHEGCDLLGSLVMIHVFCFNPHTHEGCDIPNSVIKKYNRSFNPHTHEGCDVTLTIWVLLIICFNPHTHEGCDTTSKVTDGNMQVSIHTPTKGVTDHWLTKIG